MSSMGNPPQNLPIIYLGVDEKAVRLKERISQECKDKKLSLAAFIRLCINEYFENHPPNNQHKSDPS